MRAALDQAAPPETELLTLGVTAGAALCGWAWLAEGLPLPQCAFRAITGCPCPTCGATRCLMALLHGRLRESLGWNPLVFAAICGIAALNLYCAGVVLADWPPLRVSLSGPGRRALAACGILIVAANWIYEVHRLGSP